MQEMQFRSLGSEDPLEKEMTTHSSILAWKIPGEGNDNPLQYSCLEDPLDRGVRQATFHGVAQS